MATREHPPGFVASMNHRRAQQVRERIQASKLIDRLTGIAQGKVTAEPHQVTAALGLLKKVLPDLTATDLSTGGEAISINLVQYGPQPQAILVGPSRRGLGREGRKATLGTDRARAKSVPHNITQDALDIIPPGGINPDREPASLVSLTDSAPSAELSVASS